MSSAAPCRTNVHELDKRLPQRLRKGLVVPVQASATSSAPVASSSYRRLVITSAAFVMSLLEAVRQTRQALAVCRDERYSSSKNRVKATPGGQFPERVLAFQSGLQALPAGVGNPLVINYAPNGPECRVGVGRHSSRSGRAERESHLAHHRLGVGTRLGGDRLAEPMSRSGKPAGTRALS